MVDESTGAQETVTRLSPGIAFTEVGVGGHSTVALVALGAAVELGEAVALGEAVGLAEIDSPGEPDGLADAEGLADVEVVGLDDGADAEGSAVADDAGGDVGSALDDELESRTPDRLLTVVPLAALSDALAVGLANALADELGELVGLGDGLKVGLGELEGLGDELGDELGELEAFTDAEGLGFVGQGSGSDTPSSCAVAAIGVRIAAVMITLARRPPTRRRRRMEPSERGRLAGPGFIGAPLHRVQISTPSASLHAA